MQGMWVQPLVRELRTHVPQLERLRTANYRAHGTRQRPGTVGGKKGLVPNQATN